MSEIDIHEIRTWAEEAGALARSYFGRAAGWKKADRTPVSEADGLVEQLLVTRIRQRFPEHAIIGEEYGQVAGNSEFLWSIDPIDGTASFLAGLPMWCVSIGVLRHGQPYLGVIMMPTLGDCYWNEPDGRAFYNGHVIQAIAAREWVGDDWVAAPSDLHKRYRFGFRGKARGTGSIALGIAYVARGSALGSFISRVSLWDIAGALAILHAAGGNASFLDGRQLHTQTMIHGESVGPLVFAGNAHLEALRQTIEFYPHKR